MRPRSHAASPAIERRAMSPRPSRQAAHGSRRAAPKARVRARRSSGPGFAPSTMRPASRRPFASGRRRAFGHVASIRRATGLSGFATAASAAGHGSERLDRLAGLSGFASGSAGGRGRTARSGEARHGRTSQGRRDCRASGHVEPSSGSPSSLREGRTQQSRSARPRPSRPCRQRPTS
jgi:hypothetical protein